MRRDLLGKHAGVKATAVDINTFGVSGGDTYTDAAGNDRLKTLANIQADAATYKMADEDFVHQQPSTMELALNANVISQEQARRISSNPDLSKFIESESVREKLRILAGTSGDTAIPVAQQPSSQTPTTARTETPPNTSSFTQAASGFFVPQSVVNNTTINNTPSAAPPTLTISHDTPTPTPTPHQTSVSFSDNQGRSTPGAIHPEQATDYHDRMNR